MALTPKQARFVEEYLIDLNATQAAIRAGYSPETATPSASRLLTNVNVQDAIATAQSDRSERTKITQDNVLLEIARLAFSDMRKIHNEDGSLIPLHKLDDHTAHAISSVKIKTSYVKDADGNMIPENVVEYKLWDKNSALEKAAKHIGVIVDRLKVGGDGEEPVRLELNDIGRGARVAAILDAARKRRTGQPDSGDEGVGASSRAPEGSDREQG